MMLTEPPIPQNFADGAGNLSPSWRIWTTNIHAVLKLSGQSIPVVQLPVGTYRGQTTHVPNGRKAGEGPGAGTGIPAWFDGTVWRTFYDNSVVAS